MKKRVSLFAMATLAICVMSTSQMVLASDCDGLEKYGMLPIYGTDVEDGVYPVDILYDAVNVKGICGELTVEDGDMQAELSIEGADIVQTCTIPVPALNKEFTYSVLWENTEERTEISMLIDASSLPSEALKVTLPDYDKIEAAMTAYEEKEAEEEEKSEAYIPAEPVALDRKDGEYSIQVDLTGGSGKAYISSPAILCVRDGKAYARLAWSSENYDYMIVGGEKYLPVNETGNSVFEVPITVLDGDMYVIADTTAMGTPHEVNYVLNFYSDSIASKAQMPQEAAKRVLAVALVIIIGGGILSHYLKKKNQY